MSIHGVEVAVDPEHVSPKMMRALRSGEYERPEAAQIDQIVQEGDRVVELGAGLGLISAKVALTGRARHVAVYEANPRLIPLIARTHALNGAAVEVENAVVIPASGPATLPFYIRRDFWASSLSPEPWGYDTVIDVPTVSFADMLVRHAPTMLIVDIEGGELELFRDVPLTGVRKVYIELHQNVVGRVGMKRIFDFFSSRDFHYDQWHSARNVILFSHVLR